MINNDKYVTVTGVIIGVVLTVITITGLFIILH
jgi:hypothetical protein